MSLLTEECSASDADYYEAALRILLVAGQRKRDRSGRPLIQHSVEVSALVERPDEKVVALLHDVVEDTDTTLDYLHGFFPSYIVCAVGAITRKEGEVYHSEYIPRCLLNTLARGVKKADSRYNLERCIADGDGDLAKRYVRVLAAIETFKDEHG